jgi:LCP family protein required for cell wall assembly
MIGSDVNRSLPAADLTNFNRPRPAAQEPTSRPSSQQRSSGHDATTLRPAAAQGLTRTDIDDSLREVDQTPPKDKKSRKRDKRHKGAPSRRRRIIKWSIIAIIVAIVAAGIYVLVHVVFASNAVFKGDIFGLVQQKELKKDDGGRTNILLFGTSEDDTGHQAAWLTDSIMVLSINQTTKDAYMVSIPRDLEVQYDDCPGGTAPSYVTKINVAYSCYYEDGKNEEAGAKALISQVSKVTGLDIPYYAHVNYSVVRDIVNALGTVTVDIQGSGGAPGILDQNFDWKCGVGDYKVSRAEQIRRCPPNGHFIDYPNGPATLDAEHALYLAQARGDDIGKETYGLGNSNFDREQNQQKIIVAIKDKALSSGTLTDIGKVTGLVDAIGSNLRTNFDKSEVRTLMSLAQDIPNDSIKRINLLDEKILNANAQPAKGKLDFTGIHAYLKKVLYATGITKEDPHVIVLNASGVAGAAQTEADKLEALGITIDAVDNAPQGEYTKNVIYRVGPSPKTKTAEKLTQLYGAEPKAVESIPGITVGDDTDYVVILVKVATSTSDD